MYVLRAFFQAYAGPIRTRIGKVRYGVTVMDCTAGGRAGSSPIWIAARIQPIETHFDMVNGSASGILSSLRRPD